MTVLTQSYSFSFKGQTFGGAHSPYQILSVDGLEALPPLRVQDDNRGYNDGMFSGRDFYAGRHVSIIFNTFGSDGLSAQDNFNTIQSILLPQTSGTTPLYFLMPPDQTQFLNARVRGMKSTVDANYTYGYITAQVEFFCPDPCYYSNNLQSAYMEYSTVAGRTYNKTFDYTYGGGSVIITSTVTNNGWTDTYPTITIKGPITDPIVGNVTQNKYLNLVGTYTDTDVIVIDLYNKLITLNGQPARNILSTGEWFSASPGNNEYYFTGTGTLAGTTEAVVTWHSAYV